MKNGSSPVSNSSGQAKINNLPQNISTPDILENNAYFPPDVDLKIISFKHLADFDLTIQEENKEVNPASTLNLNDSESEDEEPEHNEHKTNKTMVSEALNDDTEAPIENTKKQELVTLFKSLYTADADLKQILKTEAIIGIIQYYQEAASEDGVESAEAQVFDIFAKAKGHMPDILDDSEDNPLLSTFEEAVDEGLQHLNFIYNENTRANLSIKQNAYLLAQAAYEVDKNEITQEAFNLAYHELVNETSALIASIEENEQLEELIPQIATILNKNEEQQNLSVTADPTLENIEELYERLLLRTEEDPVLDLEFSQAHAEFFAANEATLGTENTFHKVWEQLLDAYFKLLTTNADFKNAFVNEVDPQNIVINTWVATWAADNASISDQKKRIWKSFLETMQDPEQQAIDALNEAMLTFAKDLVASRQSRRNSEASIVNANGEILQVIPPENEFAAPMTPLLQQLKNNTPSMMELVKDKKQQIHQLQQQGFNKYKQREFEPEF